MLKECINSKIGESYIKAVLDCGLQIYVCEKKDYNSSYALFGTKYGSIDTKFSLGGENFTEVPEGIAHFLEHKLFESEDGDAFSRFAKTGASANAFTSFDRTCYLFSCGDKVYENLEILLDFVQHPYFTEKTVNKEQGIISQEIRMYDDSPNWCVFFNLLKALYVKHPVRIDIAGTVDSISQITAELLYDCYNTFYDLSNMFICIAGNVDADKVFDIVNKNLINVRNNKITRAKFNEPLEISSTYVENRLEVAMPLFSMGYKLDADYINASLYNKIAMNVALEVLSGDCSILSKNLTENELINDTFESELFIGNGYGAVIFSGESNDIQSVKQNIQNEINSITQNGFDIEILNAVKRSMYGDAIRRFGSTEAIAMQLVECAMNNDNLFEELEIIKEISYDDVINSLKMLKEELCALSVVLPVIK